MYIVLAMSKYYFFLEVVVSLQIGLLHVTSRGRFCFTVCSKYKLAAVIYSTRSQHGAFIQEYLHPRLIKVLSALAYFLRTCMRSYMYQVKRVCQM